MARRWWTLAAVSVGTFMLLLDVTIVNVALPDIQVDLGASLSDLQWVIDAYALTLAALMLTAGSLADLLGRRLLFAIGTAIFTTGSLACGLSTGPLFLTLARAGQGVGGATMFATALALLANAFRADERAVAFGVFGAVTGVSVAVGPVIGGLITGGFSWRWIFLVNVPVGIVGIAITLLRVDESREPGRRRPDLIGFVTFSGGLGALVFGLIRGNTDGWTSATVVGSLGGAVLLLAVFVAAEALVRQPMLDLALLRKPTFSGGLIAAFALSGCLFAMITYLVLYLQTVLGYSAVATGVRLLVLTGAIFFMAGVTSKLTDRVPVRLQIGLGFVLVGTGLLLMRGIDAESTWTHLVPGLVTAGVGAGLINVPLVSTAVGVVSPERAGMASGINTTFREVGIATGIAGLGAVFTAHVRGSVVSTLSYGPLRPEAGSIAGGVAGGHTEAAVAAAPVDMRGTVLEVARSSFVDGLNHILLIGGLVAFGAAVACAALIRRQDFIPASASASAPVGVAVVVASAGAPAARPVGQLTFTHRLPRVTTLTGHGGTLNGHGARVAAGTRALEQNLVRTWARSL